MILFLYGQDTYRLHKKLDEIISGHKKVNKDKSEIVNFDCRKYNYNNFKDEIRQISIFRKKKLVIITNAFSSSDFSEKFLGGQSFFLKADDIMLFYEEGKVDKRKGLFNFLKLNAKSQEFTLLSGQKLENWVKEKFKKLGGKVSGEAIKILCEYVGNDLWKMDNEINKLIAFSGGETIKSVDVKTIVKPKIEISVFNTIDAISQKNKRQALSLLHKHLENDDSPLYLLAMIEYQFKNLLIIKDLVERRQPYNVVVKRSGLHPFAAKKSYFQSQKFSFLQLKKIYRNILQIDFNIKTGKIEAETALDMFVSKI